MEEIFKKTGSVLRELGFRGSGQTYRKVDGDFLFVINFQRSRRGDVFYVNLGAQPKFVPTDEAPSLETLKEYQCIWRRRVGSEWPPLLSEQRFQAFLNELVTSQQAFFDHAKTFPAALTTLPPEELLKEFSAGTTKARASLHLARAALALNHPAIAGELARQGISLASDGATILLTELRAVLAQAT